MARRTIVLAPPRRSAPAPVIIAGGGRSGALRRLAGRGASAAAKQALQRRHTFAALGAAGVLGYMTRTGSATSLPHIEALGVPGTYALAAYALGEVTKSRTMQHMATGLGAVALYELARTSSFLGPAGGAPGGGAAMRGIL